MATTIITDGLQERAREAPRVVLPARAGLFAERAARYASLARGHPMGDYLQVMAALSRAQQAALQARRAEAIAPELLDHSRAHGMPPLSALSFARSPRWRDDLREIAQACAAAAAAPVAASASVAVDLADIVDRLLVLSFADVEALADRVLAGDTLDADAAFVPFIGAALQVHFTRLAATLTPIDVGACDVATVCPVCATRPGSSVVRIGGAQANLRYLVCALCQTEWNLPRIVCSACEQDKGIAYLTLSPPDAAAQPDRSRGNTEFSTVRAETCSNCQSYLKIIYQESDPLADPIADDLATLALDVLVDEQGFARSGPNLLFHPGSA